LNRISKSAVKAHNYSKKSKDEYIESISKREDIKNGFYEDGLFESKGPTVGKRNIGEEGVAAFFTQSRTG
jgi:hypothetical protein